MLTWPQIGPLLIKVITDVGVDPSRQKDGFEAQWREGQNRAVSDSQRLSLRLKITSVYGVGEDETRYEDTDDGLSATQVGQRKFTLQVQAITTEHTYGVWCMLALERIRTRIRRPRNIDLLLENDVSIIEIRQAVKSNFDDRGRSASAGTMDIVMGCVVNDTDDVPTGVIESVVVTSMLQDTNGVELPVPPNWFEELWAPPVT